MFAHLEGPRLTRVDMGDGSWNGKRRPHGVGLGSICAFPNRTLAMPITTCTSFQMEWAGWGNNPDVYYRIYSMAIRIPARTSHTLSPTSEVLLSPPRSLVL